MTGFYKAPQLVNVAETAGSAGFSRTKNRSVPN
jgi:hypothetical protein